MVDHYKHIFLSYSHKDRRFALRLKASLEQEGFKIWIDTTELRAGDSVQGRIEQAISNAEYVLIVLSSNSVSSSFVQEELRTAMAKQRSDQRRFVVPLLYRDCEIPPFLWDRLYIDFTKGNRFNLAFDQLLRAVSNQPERYSTTETILPEKDFIKLVEENVDLDTANLMKNSVLTPYLLTALNMKVLSRDFFSQLLMIMTIVSNNDRIPIPNHYHWVFLGFTRDILKSTVIGTDLFRCLELICLEKSIDYVYRRMAFGAILEREETRHLFQKTVMEIFPKYGFDPLADHLVRESFCDDLKLPDGWGTMEALWKICPPSVRRNIITYIIKTSLWASPPRVTEYAHENSDFNFIVDKLNTCWQGLLDDSQDEERFGKALVTFEAFTSCQSTNIGKIVENMEIASRLCTEHDTDMSIKLNAPFQSEKWDNFCKINPHIFTDQLLMELIASPYISSMNSISMLTNIFINNNYDFSVLSHHPAFPMCLFKVKLSGSNIFKEIYIFDTISMCASNGLEYLFDYCMLVNLSIAFTSREAHSAMYSRLERRKLLKNSYLRTLRNYLEGKTSRQSLVKYYEKIKKEYLESIDK